MFNVTEMLSVRHEPHLPVSWPVVRCCGKGCTTCYIIDRKKKKKEAVRNSFVLLVPYNPVQPAAYYLE